MPLFTNCYADHTVVACNDDLYYAIGGVLRQFSPDAHAASGALPATERDCAKIATCSKGKPIVSAADWNVIKPAMKPTNKPSDDDGTRAPLDAKRVMDELFTYANSLTGATPGDYVRVKGPKSGLWFLMAKSHPDWSQDVRLSWMERANELLVALGREVGGGIKILGDQARQYGVSLINEKIPGTKVGGVDTVGYTAMSSGALSGIFVECVGPKTWTSVVLQKMKTCPNVGECMKHFMFIMVHEFTHVQTGIRPHPQEFWNNMFPLQTKANKLGFPTKG